MPECYRKQRISTPYLNSHSIVRFCPKYDISSLKTQLCVCVCICEGSVISITSNKFSLFFFSIFIFLNILEHSCIRSISISLPFSLPIALH